MLYGISGILIILLLVCFIIFTNKIKKIKQEQYEQVWNKFQVENADQINILKERIIEKQKELDAVQRRIIEQVKTADDFITEEKSRRLKQMDIDIAAALKARQEKADEEYWKFYKENESLMDYIKEETQKAQAELNEFNKKRASINEAIMRERKIQEQQDFYRIIVPEKDQKDIEILETIAPKLNNSEAIHKLEFEIFIKRPLMEMIKRILGNKDICGIYKITYIKTGEAYIGKSTHIDRRWGEHIKSAFGVGTIAHTSFHNRLAQDGVWNYTFEVLEETNKDKLTEREKFYINLYETDTQLNMKVG